MGTGTEDKAEGTWGEMRGKLKEKVGDTTVDERMEEEGRVDQVKGGGKQAKGDLKNASKKVKDAVRDATD